MMIIWVLLHLLLPFLVQAQPAPFEPAIKLPIIPSAKFANVPSHETPTMPQPLVFPFTNLTGTLEIEANLSAFVDYAQFFGKQLEIGVSTDQLVSVDIEKCRNYIIEKHFGSPHSELVMYGAWYSQLRELAQIKCYIENFEYFFLVSSMQNATGQVVIRVSDHSIPLPNQDDSDRLIVVAQYFHQVKVNRVPLDSLIEQAINETTSISLFLIAKLNVEVTIEIKKCDLQPIFFTINSNEARMFSRPELEQINRMASVLCTGDLNSTDLDVFVKSPVRVKGTLLFHLAHPKIAELAWTVYVLKFRYWIAAGFVFIVFAQLLCLLWGFCLGEYHRKKIRKANHFPEDKNEEHEMQELGNTNRSVDEDSSSTQS